MTIVPSMDNRISSGNLIVAVIALISPLATLGGVAFFFGGQDNEIAAHDKKIGENAANIAQINERVRTLASTPVIVASARAGSGRWVNARPLSTSQGTARVFSVVSVSTPVIVDIKVTGRWL